MEFDLVVMLIYNKLIRDRVPEFIEGENKSFRTRVLDDLEFHGAVINKVREMGIEYRYCKTRDVAIGELADLLNFIHENSKENYFG